MKTLPIIAALGAMALLAGCNRGGGGGPDEFAVLPSRALTIPAVLSLPQPTPGGANRTDPNPVGDAIAALGGNPAAARAGGIPAGDAALVATAGASDPAIRQTLAAEAAARTGGARPGTQRYYARLAGQRLDAGAELARWRAAGVATPSAPPEG